MTFNPEQEKLVLIGARAIGTLGALVQGSCDLPAETVERIKAMCDEWHEECAKQRAA